MYPDFIPEGEEHNYPQLVRRGVVIPDYAPDVELPVAMCVEIASAEETPVAEVEEDAPKRGRPRKVVTDGSDTG